MKTLTISIAALLCASCVNQVDYMVRNHPQKGDQHFYMFTAWGGQHAAESSAGTRYAGTVEKSFADAAQAIVAVKGFDAATKQLLYREVTERYKAGQITIQQKQAFDAAIAQSGTAAELQVALAKIASGS